MSPASEACSGLKGSSVLINALQFVVLMRKHLLSYVRVIMYVLGTPLQNIVSPNRLLHPSLLWEKFWNDFSLL